MTDRELIELAESLNAQLAEVFGERAELRIVNLEPGTGV